MVKSVSIVPIPPFLTISSVFIFGFIFYDMCPKQTYTKHDGHLHDLVPNPTDISDLAHFGIVHDGSFMPLTQQTNN